MIVLLSRHSSTGGLYAKINRSRYDTSAKGRFSGWIDGKDLRLKLKGNRLHGRIGGVLNGKDVNAKVDGVPLGVAVLAALCAYKALEDHEAGQRTEEQRNS